MNTLNLKITKDAIRWANAADRREGAAAESDEKFAGVVVENYGDDLSPEFRSAMSGALKALLTGKSRNGNKYAAKASKVVKHAWLITGLRSVGVESVPGVKVKDHTADSLRLVVNGEGGADLKPFRNGITELAEAGRWADIAPAIEAWNSGFVPQPDKSDDDNESGDDNETPEVPNTSRRFSPADVARLVREVADVVTSQEMVFTPDEATAIADAIAALDSLVGEKVAAETVAA